MVAHSALKRFDVRLRIGRGSEGVRVLWCDAGLIKLSYGCAPL